MRIADVIECNLHKLDNCFVRANREERTGAAIDRINHLTSQCACEVNGVDFDPDNVTPMNNPFAKPALKYQSNASLSEKCDGVPLVWRTINNSLHLEVIL